MQDVLEDSNRNNTGWTLDRIRVLSEHHGWKERRRKNMPKSGGGFYVEREPFMSKWTEKDEERYG